MSKGKSKGARPKDAASPTSTSASTSGDRRSPQDGEAVRDDAKAPSAPAAASTPASASTSTAASSATDPWTGYWLAPVAAVRPWLLTKLTLFLFAFDVLHTHLGPAWRYGAADFNVPHFAFLRALPIPTTAAYVGMLFFVSTSALVCALVPPPPRPLLFAIAAPYTWGWAFPMHDSYQHHYLPSFPLLAIALLPTPDSPQVFRPAPAPDRRAEKLHEWEARHPVPLVAAVAAEVAGWAAIVRGGHDGRRRAVDLGAV